LQRGLLWTKTVRRNLRPSTSNLRECDSFIMPECMKLASTMLFICTETTCNVLMLYRVLLCSQRYQPLQYSRLDYSKSYPEELDQLPCNTAHPKIWNPLQRIQVRSRRARSKLYSGSSINLSSNLLSQAPPSQHHCHPHKYGYYL
jgi:hypothetical protein